MSFCKTWCVAMSVSCRIHVVCQCWCFLGFDLWFCSFCLEWFHLWLGWGDCCLSFCSSVFSLPVKLLMLVLFFAVEFCTNRAFGCSVLWCSCIFPWQLQHFFPSSRMMFQLVDAFSNRSFNGLRSFLLMFQLLFESKFLALWSSSFPFLLYVVCSFVHLCSTCFGFIQVLVILFLWALCFPLLPSFGVYLSTFFILIINQWKVHLLFKIIIII